MSAQLFVCEPVTKRQRRWLSYLPNNSIDRGGVAGIFVVVGLLLAGVLGGGLLATGSTVLGWVLAALGVLVTLVPLFTVRLIHQHAAKVEMGYSFNLFRTRAVPEEVNAALRALAADDLELSRELGQQYWSAVKAENSRDEERLRGQLLELFTVLKERDELTARVLGKASLSEKLKTLREERDELRQVLGEGR